MRRTKAELVDEVTALRGRINDLETGITGRKQAEEDLARQKMLADTILDNMDQGITLYDADLNLVMCNKASYELSDLPAELLAPGSSIEGVFRFNAQRGEYGPGDVEEQVRERIERNRKFEAHQFERELLNGTILEIRGRPLPGGGFVSTYTDITERKKAEEATVESEARFRAVIDNMPSFVSLKDKEGRFLLVNQKVADLSNTTVEALIGKTMHDLVPADRADTYREQDRKVLTTDSLVINEFKAPGPTDGEEQVLLVQKFPIHSPSGETVAVGAITTDITERKRVEEELRKLNEELELRVEQRTRELILAKVAAEEAAQVKSNFLLAMSHELRTPVNQIIGYSELLAEDAEDASQENMVTDLEKIRSAGQSLLAMIIDVLDLSDLETGAMKIVVEEFDLTALIADVETTAAPLMEANRNTFTVVTGSEIGTMRSDPAKVRRCLDNLLSNAAKFTEAGRVELRVGSSGDDRLAFSVTDSGIGMTLEQRANLFQAFTQVEVGATRSHDGAGLGLAITQRFCAMLGGDVSVESEPGEGSTFTITLPAVVPAAD